MDARPYASCETRVCKPWWLGYSTKRDVRFASARGSRTQTCCCTLVFSKEQPETPSSLFYHETVKKNIYWSRAITTIRVNVSCWLTIIAFFCLARTRPELASHICSQFLIAQQNDTANTACSCDEAVSKGLRKSGAAQVTCVTPFNYPICYIRSGYILTTSD